MTIEYKDSKRIVKLSTDTVETPTYSDDFSSYSDQTAADAAWITNSTTEFRANPTNDNLDIDGGLGTSSALCTKDFGAGNISDTKWVLRFDINVTEYTKSTTAGHEHSMLIGLSDVNTDIWNSSHDSITIGVYYSNGEAVYKIASADGTSHYSGTRTNTSTIPSVDHLWFELIRTSATGATLNIYTDEYVTLDSTTSITVASTCASLRYFHLNIEATGSPNGNYVGVLDNIKLFNGISSITSKPTNVQDNSLLVEKDTARRYWFDGTNWTKQTSAIPTVSGLKLHLDASDSTTITKDGSNLVSQWDDKSGEGNHLTQSTASKQPLWVNDTLDTLPVIRFDGSDDFMNRSTFVNGAISQGFYMFIVMKPSETGTTPYNFDSASGTRGFCYSDNPAGLRYGCATDVAVDSSLPSTHVIYTFFVNGASSNVRKNSTSINSSNLGSSTINGLWLAVRHNEANQGNAEFAEFLIYDNDIGTTNRDAIESYLTDKWGL
jgi:hypothetical protein